MKKRLHVRWTPGGGLGVFLVLLGGCQSDGGQAGVNGTPDDARVAKEPHTTPQVRSSSTDGEVKRPAAVSKPPVPGDRKPEVVEQQWPNGMVSERIEGYRSGEGEFVRHGPFLQFYDDGTKRTELHYRDGEKHGARVSWYPTGQIWARGEYDQGMENGTWTAWWPNGFKQREWIMRRGAWHGSFTEWHDNGEKKMEFEYVNGLKQGPMTIWDSAGNVVNKSEYVNDVEQP